MYVEKGEGSGSGNRDFDSHKCFMSFLSQKICLCSCFMRQLIPQAKVAPKIWKLVHKVGKLWQNFLKICAENSSHSYYFKLIK